MAQISIANWCKKAEEITEEVFQGFAYRLSTAVQDGTPVDTTALFRSWTSSIGETVLAKVVTKEEALAGDFGTDDIKPVTRVLAIGDKYNFATAQPYAAHIEYGAGSMQAIHGMMRINIAKSDYFLRMAVNDARRT